MSNPIDTGSLSTSISTKISGGNSTDVPLSVASFFTGEWEVTTNFTTLVCSLITDQVGILFLEFSPNGTDVDDSIQYVINATEYESHRIVIKQKYFRARIFNAAVVDQTYIRLQVTYGNHPLQLVPLNGIVQIDSDALLTKAVINGTDIGGAIVPIEVISGAVSVTGNVKSGLSIRMKISNIVINDVASIIPPLSLEMRNSILIENKGPDSVFIGESDVTASGPEEGWEILPTTFFSTDVTDAISIYAISPIGSTNILKIMELA
jgi:hypothetical protein